MIQASNNQQEIKMMDKVEHYRIDSMTQLSARVREGLGEISKQYEPVRAQTEMKNPA